MREITFMEAIREAIRHEMRLDENVFLLGQDAMALGGAHGVNAGLLDEFGPERVMDTPISESAMMGAAIGAALMGLRPISDLMCIEFTPVCMDYLTNQAPKFRFMCGGQVEKLPIVVRAASGGYVHNAGQHSLCLEGWFIQVPGIKVVMPSNAYDAKGLFTSCLRDNNPVLFIEHRMLYGFAGPVPEDEYLIPLGKANIKREGEDVTLISYSFMMQKTLAVAQKLAEDGINAEVIDLMTLAPLDHEALARSVRKTRRAVVVQEAHGTAGVASQVIKSLTESSFDYLDAPVKTVGAEDTVVAFSPPLEDATLPDEEKILATVASVMA